MIGRRPRWKRVGGNRVWIAITLVGACLGLVYGSFRGLRRTGRHAW